MLGGAFLVGAFGTKSLHFEALSWANETAPTSSVKCIPWAPKHLLSKKAAPPFLLPLYQRPDSLEAGRLRRSRRMWAALPALKRTESPVNSGVLLLFRRQCDDLFSLLVSRAVHWSRDMSQSFAKSMRSGPSAVCSALGGAFWIRAAQK